MAIYLLRGFVTDAVRFGFRKGTKNMMHSSSYNVDCIVRLSIRSEIIRILFRAGFL